VILGVVRGLSSERGFPLLIEMGWARLRRRLKEPMRAKGEL
jgi:hypothetical protein